jgi:nucleotide-binding universal stress UspA family protein
MKRVLIATDGSDHARKALAVAAEIAAKFESELLILHVVTDNPLSERERGLIASEHVRQLAASFTSRAEPADPDVSVHGLLLRESEMSAALRNIVGERLLSDAESLARSVGVGNVHTILAHGDPARMILSAANENAADAIVMGSRGFGELRSFLLGSVAHKIAHVTHCTTVIVK